MCLMCWCLWLLNLVPCPHDSECLDLIKDSSNDYKHIYDQAVILVSSHHDASNYWYYIGLISLLCVNSFQPRFDSLQGTVAASTIPQGKSGVEGTASASLSSLGRSIRQDTSVAQRSHWNLGTQGGFLVKSDEWRIIGQEWGMWDHWTSWIAAFPRTGIQYIASVYRNWNTWGCSCPTSSLTIKTYPNLRSVSLSLLKPCNSRAWPDRLVAWCCPAGTSNPQDTPPVHHSGLRSRLRQGKRTSWCPK